MPGAPIPCSQSSLEAGEPLWGTANEGVLRWVMVEHPGPWGAKVPKQAEGLSDAARARLLALDAGPHTRVQLIRRPRAHEGPDGVSVLVARVDEQGGALFQSRLADMAALEQLDPDAVIASGARLAQPVIFVCTHGTRDACCARHGMPFYTRVAAHVPERTWQCSHLGGHRFAPTVLVLPHGAVYGRVPAEQAEALAQAADAGRLHDPATLRGRSCHPAPVQAAEAMLRADMGELAVDAVRVREATELDAGHWRVVLACAGVEHTLELQRETLAARAYASCGDETPQPVARFRRLTHRRAGRHAGA